MKRSITIVFATFMAFVIFQISGYRLLSHAEFPPSGGLANDPGQSNCAHCHSAYGAPFVRNSQFIIRIAPDSAGLSNNGSIVTPTSRLYTPNHPNWVSIELLGTNTNAAPDTPFWGFQFTALDSATSHMSGRFYLVDPNTSTQDNSFTQNGVNVVPPSDTVFYVGHYNPRPLHNLIHTWYFKWNPGPADSAVTFYYSGNMGNGNLGGDPDLDFPDADSIFVGQVTLYPGPASNVGIANIAGNIHSVSVYPVPFGQQLTADMYLNTSSPVSLTLLSIDGQAIRELYNGVASQGHFNKSFEVGDIAEGMYFVRIQSGTDSRVVKVLKY